MNIPVTFFVDEIASIMLKWPAVPRKGDIIDLSTVNPNMPTAYVVDDVLWRHVAGEVAVSVYCRKIK